MFHQFNIPSISARQADTSYGPRQTYGIQLKGSSFLRRYSSLNFLRSRSERALFKKRYCHFQKSVDSADTLLPFNRHVVKRCVWFRNVCKPSSSLPAIFIPPLKGTFKKLHQLISLAGRKKKREKCESHLTQRGKEESLYFEEGKSK